MSKLSSPYSCSFASAHGKTIVDPAYIYLVFSSCLSWPTEMLAFIPTECHETPSRYTYKMRCDTLWKKMYCLCVLSSSKSTGVTEILKYLSNGSCGINCSLYFKRYYVLDKAVFKILNIKSSYM